MKVVQEEGMTVSGAAKQFHMPRKALDIESRVIQNMGHDLVL